jgi:hypothetical protein
MIGKEKKVKLNEIEVIVKKLPIGKVIKILNDVGQLPDELAITANQSEADVLKNLPVKIALVLPQLAHIIVSAVDDPRLTKDYLINDCFFDDAIMLIEAIIEVNDVEGIINRVKKIQILSTETAKRQQIQEIRK